MFLIQQAQANHAQADKGQYHREQQRFGKHLVRQITQVHRHAHAAKDHEQRSAQQQRNAHQAEVDQAVQGFVPFTVGVQQRQAEPEGQQSGQITPERVVLASATVDHQEYQQRRQAKPQ
ncbi:hypothetical protein D9M71_578650 [compost metagenome]